MPNIRITAKRQATFPKALCDQMGLKPGDSVEVEPRELGGERVWVLKPPAPPPAPARPWFGMAGRHIRNVEDHSMDAVRESIARGRAAEAAEGE